MIISKRLMKGGNPLYIVCADCKETGGKCPHDIVSFDDFETAVIVMKYMRGDRMPEEDQRYAKEAISRV